MLAKASEPTPSQERHRANDGPEGQTARERERERIARMMKEVFAYCEDRQFSRGRGRKGKQTK